MDYLSETSSGLSLHSIPSLFDTMGPSINYVALIGGRGSKIADFETK